MKTERSIGIAFILNLAFSVFEFFGGLITGSVAILSDAVHDLGDAASIGISFYLERKSKRSPDAAYTYGYGRYSVLGGLITCLILLVGSVIVIVKAINGIISPSQIDYDGMILFAVVGVTVNFIAAYVTHKGDSLNQKAVNLHMLEDVLGWAVILAGAVVMRFTDFAFLDPILSIGVSFFVLFHAIRTVGQLLEVFLEKAPHGVSAAEIQEDVSDIQGVADVHHIHLWSMDGNCHYATMHVVTDADPHVIKDKIRHVLQEHGIVHVTLELESTGVHCHERTCCVHTGPASGHCGHHHHH